MRIQSKMGTQRSTFVPQDQDISAWLKGRPRRVFDKGQVVIATNHQSGFFGHVHEGLVKCQASAKTTRKRGARTVDIYVGGQWIGTELFGFPANAFKYVATGPTEVTLIDLGEFDSLPAPILMDMGRQMARRRLNLAAQVLMANESVRIRVLHRLHALREDVGMARLRVTQHDLADMVGSTQAGISHELADLVKSGIVRRGYGSYEVTDSEALFLAAMREARRDG